MTRGDKIWVCGLFAAGLVVFLAIVFTIPEGSLRHMASALGVVTWAGLMCLAGTRSPLMARKDGKIRVLPRGLVSCEHDFFMASPGVVTAVVFPPFGIGGLVACLIGWIVR